MDKLYKNIKYRYRFGYGCIHFAEHFLGKKLSAKLLTGARRRFYRNLHESLKKHGEGKIVPLERRKDLSLKEFREHYLRKGIPVVMEGAAKDWPCVQKWSLEYFKELHGTDEIVMASQEYMQDVQKMTLAEVIDNISSGGKKYYRFYPLLDRHPEHIKDFDYKWLLERKNKFSLFDTFQLFLGGKDTLTHIHNANPPNLFVQVYGEKDWIIYPHQYSMIVDPEPVRNVYRNAPYKKDGKPFDPFHPDYEAPYSLYKYVNGYSVNLKPGDVFWNPPFYWHTVQNPTDSIGVGYRWTAPFYSFKIAPLYMFLDLFAIHPPIWKSYRLLKKDQNLVHLAEAGKLDDYMKNK